MHAELKQVLADVLGVGSVSDADSVHTIPAWDSVRHISLIVALEERFGVTFDIDEIPALNSVQAISEALARHAAAQNR